MVSTILQINIHIIASASKYIKKHSLNQIEKTTYQQDNIATRQHFNKHSQYHINKSTYQQANLSQASKLAYQHINMTLYTHKHTLTGTLTHIHIQIVLTSNHYMVSTIHQINMS